MRVSEIRVNQIRVNQGLGVFKLKRKFTFAQIYVITIDNLHWQYFHEQKVRNLGLF